jgi:CheY-like chemotaxis protein
MLTNLVKKNLLLIDDQPVIGLLLKHKLQGEYNVTVKLNGAEALTHMLEGYHTDLVLLDLNMPEMNGIEFIKAVRKMNCYQHLPLVVLSGESCEDSISEAFESGADDFLTKTFNHNELKDKLEKFFS